MEQKEALLFEAQAAFPDYYFERKKENPEFFLIKGQNFPLVQEVIVHRYIFFNGKEETFYPNPSPKDLLVSRPEKHIIREDLKLSLRLITRKKEWRVHLYCSIQDGEVDCCLRTKMPRNTAHFAEEFTKFFFYEFLSEKEITPNYWNLLDLIGQVPLPYGKSGNE